MASQSSVSSTVFNFLIDTSPILKLDISKDKFLKSVELEESTYFAVDMKDKKIASMPLAPFTYIIRENQVPLQTIEKKAYSLQKNTLVSYFQSGFANERYDLINYEEVSYEKRRYGLSIIEIMNTIQLPFIIFNAQWMSQDSKEILDLIDEENFYGKIIICSDSSKMDAEFETEDFTELYAALHNFRCFLSFNQAEYLMEHIGKNWQDFGYSNVQLAALNFEAALIRYYQKQNDKAINILNSIISNGKKNDIYSLAQIYLSLLHCLNYQTEDGRKFAEDAIASTSWNKNSPLHTLAIYVQYLNNQMTDFKTIKEKYDEILELLEQGNLQNLMVNTAISVPWYFKQTNEVLLDILERIENAQSIAESMDNKFALSNVWHWKGIIYSKMDNRREAFNCFRRCNAIRTKIGDILSIAKIRNGLSYEYLIEGDFENAYDIINSFSKRINEIKDTSETLKTLANIARVLFFINKIDESYMIFTYIQKIMQNNDLKEFGVMSNSDIEIYKNIMEFYLGRVNPDIIGAFQYPVDLSDNMVPLQLYRDSLVKIEEGKLDESRSLFEQSLLYIEKHLYEEKYLNAALLFHYSFALHHCGLDEDAQKFWEKAYEYAMQNHMIYYGKYYSTEAFSIGGVLSQRFAPLSITKQFLENLLK
ncbi:MAG: hypothetical protein K5839_04945 [Treponemataceae bacterium]|nr:hypothetical protein [Treponemataceae bacterium]